MSNTEHRFADPNRHVVEVPHRFAIARWPRDADVPTIARCILGTLKYEPHSADTTDSAIQWSVPSQPRNHREIDRVAPRDRCQGFACSTPLDGLSPLIGRELGLAAKFDASRLRPRSEEHTSELQSLRHLVCRLLLEKKKS